MAFVVATKRGTYEVRESHSTPKGPRSRTLASFAELSDEVIEKARLRAEKPLDARELRDSAARAGAPVLGTPVDESAREILHRIGNGEPLDPLLRDLLADALSNPERVSGVPRPISDAARSASEWVGASLAQRGETLFALLELGDALPLRRRPEQSTFPRLRSA